MFLSLLVARCLYSSIPGGGRGGGGGRVVSCVIRNDDQMMGRDTSLVAQAMSDISELMYEWRAGLDGRS